MLTENICIKKESCWWPKVASLTFSIIAGVQAPYTFKFYLLKSGFYIQKN